MSNFFPNDPTEDDRIVKWARFENRVRRELEILYSPEAHRFQAGKTFEVRGDKFAPDHAIFLDAAELCVCVAEAKDVQRLKRDAVAQVIRYRDYLEAEKAVLFVPAGCFRSDSVNAFASTNLVEIVEV